MARDPIKAGIAPERTIFVGYAECGCAWGWHLNPDLIPPELTRRAFKAKKVLAEFDRTATNHLIRNPGTESFGVRPECRTKS